MEKLQTLEELRTRKEVKDYFKQLGKEITEEELDALKQSYDKVQKSDGALTLQQLNNIAGGGMFIEFHILHGEGGLIHDLFTKSGKDFSGITLPNGEKASLGIFAQQTDEPADEITLRAYFEDLNLSMYFNSVEECKFIFNKYYHGVLEKAAEDFGKINQSSIPDVLKLEEGKTVKMPHRAADMDDPHAGPFIYIPLGSMSNGMAALNTILHDTHTSKAPEDFAKIDKMFRCKIDDHLSEQVSDFMEKNPQLNLHNLEIYISEKFRGYINEVDQDRILNEAILDKLDDFLRSSFPNKRGGDFIFSEIYDKAVELSYHGKISAIIPEFLDKNKEAFEAIFEVNRQADRIALEVSESDAVKYSNDHLKPFNKIVK